MRSWADDFNTYQDACDFYGCDGPRQFAAEAEYELRLYTIELADRMERGEIQPGLRDKIYFFEPELSECPF
jgi:hypothetical protein